MKVELTGLTHYNCFAIYSDICHHGTAFDIAGQGVADASSTIAALELAAELVKQRGNASISSYSSSYRI